MYKLRLHAYSTGSFKEGNTIENRELSTAARLSLWATQQRVTGLAPLASPHTQQATLVTEVHGSSSLKHFCPLHLWVLGAGFWREFPSLRWVDCAYLVPPQLNSCALPSVHRDFHLRFLL